jgi:hypothetical protein
MDNGLNEADKFFFFSLALSLGDNYHHILICSRARPFVSAGM